MGFNANRSTRENNALCAYGHVALPLFSQIPSGTSSHQRIRLIGKGIARPHSYGHGDHYVHVKIDIPR